MNETLQEIRKAKIKLEGELEKLLEDFQDTHNVSISEIELDRLTRTTLGTGNNVTFKARVKIVV